MVKGFFRYLLFLIVLDAIINLAIQFMQRSPGELILTSTILRMLSIAGLFTIIGLFVFLVVKSERKSLQLIITSVLVYLCIPEIIFVLKDNNEGLFEVYSNLHTDFYLYSVTLLPFVLGSIACITLSNKLKLF